jgi:DNA gyrase, A subunit
MRYTEARMTKLTPYLLEGIEKDTVDFYPNFDETLMQPAVLPSRFPNLLVNGSSGIAVGMATNIPPHNLGEVIDGVICMIDNPDCTIDDLMQHIKGPDFPTGGIILGRRGIREAYYTGHGRIEVRAKTNIEEMPNGRSRIVVTEIPYQVNKAKLVEKIAELVHDKRIEGISDIRDESDRQGMRIVIELKKDVYPQVILNTLYKHTSMQETFGANMLALVNGQPKILSLRDMVYYYLEHQKDVVTRRTRFDLNKALARAHILEGLLKALDHIDEIVSIIRASKDPNTAKTTLMERFDFSDKQAQAILDMRLARLTGLERDRLQQEYDDLEKEIARFQAILADEHLLMEVIKTEISAIRDKFADPRRTELTTIDGEIDVEDLIQEEDMVVTLTRQGYVKRTPKSIYRAQNRGGRGVTGMTTKEEDFAVQMRVVSTHDEIMFFTNMGRVYMLKCYQIPEAGRTARGTAIINLIQIASDEKVTCMVPVPGATGEHNLVMATRDGMIKKTPYSEFANLRKNGLIAINLKEGDELIGVDLTSGDDEILLGSRKGMAIRFSERHIRPMGRASMGVKSMRLDDDDIIIDMVPLEQGADVLAITTLGYGKRTNPDEYREQGRNGKGIIATKLTDKTGDLAALLMVKPDEDLMLITDDGTIIRTRAEDIRVCGRNTQGVIVMKLQEGSHVIAVARAERDEEPDAPANAADADAAEARAEGFDTSDAAESKAVQELLRRAEEDANGSDLDMDLGGEDEKDSPADDEDI